MRAKIYFGMVGGQELLLITILPSSSPKVPEKERLEWSLCSSQPRSLLERRLRSDAKA
jgi:hypothetical protein